MTYDSAVIVTKYIQSVSSIPKANLLDVWVLKALIHILSYILGAQISSSRLTLDVLHITTDSVLVSQTLLKHFKLTFTTLGGCPHPESLMKNA